ncbi:hypothetical protein AB4K20DRAFT_1887114 [Rhizopus microsporus]
MRKSFFRLKINRNRRYNKQLCSLFLPFFYAQICIKGQMNFRVMDAFVKHKSQSDIYLKTNLISFCLTHVHLAILPLLLSFATIVF